LTEITGAVGFKTIAYFTKLFKKTNGIIPSNYRKNTVDLFDIRKIGIDVFRVTEQKQL
jgi:AraC-like DNA-binding protein